jgi:hypothetical protein
MLRTDFIETLNAMHLQADAQDDFIVIPLKNLSFFRYGKGEHTPLAIALEEEAIDLQINGTPEKRTLRIEGFTSLQKLAECGVDFNGAAQYRPFRNDAPSFSQAIQVLNGMPMKGPVLQPSNDSGLVVTMSGSIVAQLRKERGIVPPLRYSLQQGGLDLLHGSDGVVHIVGRNQLMLAAQAGLNFPGNERFRSPAIAL